MPATGRASKSRDTMAESDVFSLLKAQSNWGRWGKTDQLGTLNLVTRERVLVAAQLVRRGASVSCALPITYEKSRFDDDDEGSEAFNYEIPRHQMLRTGLADDGGPRHSTSTSDVFTIAPHGLRVTHIDAPCHCLLDGQMFNGLAAELVTQDGADAGAVDVAANGVASRGVLLDLPRLEDREYLDNGEAIFPEDLERCETAAGVKVQSGDIVLVRTGYRSRASRIGVGSLRERGWPGLQAACLPWLHERGVAVLATDTAADVFPHGYHELGMPIHAVGMWAMGLWLVDNCGLEAVSEVCLSEGRWEFFCVIAPLVLSKGTGSPVNPIAIF